MRLTLHGMVPVYVQVDVDTGEVSYVCTSDEEFAWVGRRIDGEGGHVQELHRISEDDRPLPIAYDENGNPLGDDELIARAHRIAEGIAEPGASADAPVPSGEWPAWSFGW